MGIWYNLFGDGDIKTGIDHLVELGITHVHLLPTFDHRSIDETKLDQAQYNWDMILKTIILQKVLILQILTMQKLEWKNLRKW